VICSMNLQACGCDMQDIVFVYLFNGTFNNSNCRIMNWKGCGRKESWYNPGICLEELRESKNDFSQDGWV
jgi:hypothetical protein